jgi:hypothetical protein
VRKWSSALGTYPGEDSGLTAVLRRSLTINSFSEGFKSTCFSILVAIWHSSFPQDTGVIWERMLCFQDIRWLNVLGVYMTTLSKYGTSTTQIRSAGCISQFAGLTPIPLSSYFEPLLSRTEDHAL